MNNAYEQITDKIIASLEKGKIPWKKTWAYAGPKNLKTNKEYKGINTLILSFQPYVSPYWLTYSQALTLKCNVKKREKGTQIVFWNVKKDDLTDEVLFAYMRIYTVFNSEQCENIKSTLLDNIKTDYYPIDTYKNGPTVVPGEPCYIPIRDSIRLPPRSHFKNSDEYFSTKYHEIIHSTGHTKRLAREGILSIDKASDQYAKEELIAEIGASFLCTKTGIHQNIENSIAYCQYWANKINNDKKLIFKAASAAQKAVEYLEENKL